MSIGSNSAVSLKKTDPNSYIFYTLPTYFCTHLAYYVRFPNNTEMRFEFDGK